MSPRAYHLAEIIDEEKVKLQKESDLLVKSYRETIYHKLDNKITKQEQNALNLLVNATNWNGRPGSNPESR